jgi:hypothetical protein
MRPSPPVYGLLIAALAACGASESGKQPATAGTGASGGGGIPSAGGMAPSASGATVGGAGATSEAGRPSAGQAPSGGAAPATAGSGGSASGGGASGGSAAAGGGNAGSILHADFEGAVVGTYTQDKVAADFGVTPTWNDGLDEGRASIVAEAGNQYLRVTYPAGEYGSAAGGVQFKVPFARSYDELYFAYKVRFAPGFSFVKGGKLPGLVGGSSPTGCSPKPDGFSARNMWRAGGAMVQYVYWPNQPKTCGDDVAYQLDGTPLPFAPGAWQTVEHRVKMNTAGASDGVLEAWVDGEKVVSDTARLWRGADATHAIDTLYFSTFFGGSDESWAPASEQTADYDELIVSPRPISH